eukprot:362596-Rhodomonas_salina.1
MFMVLLCRKSHGGLFVLEVTRRPDASNGVLSSVCLETSTTVNVAQPKAASRSSRPRNVKLEEGMLGEKSGMYLNNDRHAILCVTPPNSLSHPALRHEDGTIRVLNTSAMQRREERDRERDKARSLIHCEGSAQQAQGGDGYKIFITKVSVTVTDPTSPRPH